MSVTNGIVSKIDPIGLQEIANLLNEVLDIGKCCTSDNVNKWSKYKPFQYPSPETPDDAIRKDSYNWGLTISKFTSLSSIVLSSWRWSKPTTWYRLTDFAGYNHNSLRPIPLLSSQTINTYGKTSYAISTAMEMVTESGVDDLDLSLGTTKLKDCYLGVVLIKQGTTTKFYFTNTAKGLFRDVTITPSGTAFDKAGTYNAILFASDKAINFTQTSTSGNFIVLDQSLYAVITFINEAGYSISIALSGRKLMNNANSGWIITGTVTLNNVLPTSPISFNNVYLTLCSSASPGSQLPYSWSLGNFTVSANSSKVIRFGGTGGSSLDSLYGPGSYNPLYALVTASISVDGGATQSYNTTQQILLFESTDIT